MDSDREGIPTPGVKLLWGIPPLHQEGVHPRSEGGEQLFLDVFLPNFLGGGQFGALGDPLGEILILWVEDLGHFALHKRGLSQDAIH